MPIFVSYSSLDEDVVKELAQSLEAAHREVWFDHDLGGGEVWWVKILENIRKADVFVVAVSDKSLQSKPCKAELEYARELDRSIVPIIVGPVTNFRANPLSELQAMEFRPDDARSGFEIIGAVDEAAKRTPPLPEVLPAEPPIPFAYLLSMGKQIDAEPLSQAAQLDAVDGLRKAFREETDPSVQDDIVSILRRLRARPWATVQTLGEVDVMLSWIETQRRIASPPPPKPPQSEVAQDEHSRARAEKQAERDRADEFSRTIADAVQKQEVSTRPIAPPAEESPSRPSGNAPSSAPPWTPSTWTVPPAEPSPRRSDPPPAATRFPGVRSAGSADPRPAQPRFPGQGAGPAPLRATPPRTSPGTPPAQARPGAPVGRPQVTPPPPSPPPPPPGPAPMPVRAPGTKAPRPWWGLTIPSLIVLPVGLVALYFSVQVGQRAARGDAAGARKASTYALVWGLIGVFLLLLLLLLRQS